MEDCKDPYSAERQADQLLLRGLIAKREKILHRLQSVNYYRLSGYLFPFRLPASDEFIPGSSLEFIWSRYCFDRRLRVLTIGAIERIEIAVRTQLVYHFTHAHGPFGYAEDKNPPKLKIGDYLEWRLKLQEEAARSKKTFKKAFFDKYGERSLLTFFKGVEPSIKQAVGGPWQIPDTLLLSWLTSRDAARNLCAHHARFWNRELGYPPLLPQPNKFPLWHGEHKLPNNRCGIILLICRHWLRLISPTGKWNERAEALFAEYPDIPRADMGLTESWVTHPLWTS